MKELTHKKMTRRQFLLGGLFSSLSAFALMLIYPVLRFIMPPPVPESKQNSVKAALLKELKPNSSKIFAFGTKPAILVRMANGEFRAFSAVCPHLQCTVQYREDQNLIWCACHNGKFDLNGKVISGPPPAGLDIYEVFVSGEEVIVTKKA